MTHGRVRGLLLTAVLVVSAIGLSVPVSASRTFDNVERTSAIGNEGCSPGYWKNHTASWVGYTTSTTLGSVFTLPAYASSLSGSTFLDALSFAGGPTTLDKAKLLLHQAVAAFLNAANPGVGYPERRFSAPGNILATVNAALASGDNTTITNLQAHYNTLNNLACPLN